MATSSINKDLLIPYQIGRYIASLVPHLDSDENEPSACHAYPFSQGPTPFLNQMTSGLVLKVEKSNHCPVSIFTRYGEWTVLSPRNGSFNDIFDKLKHELGLYKFSEDKGYHSFWTIHYFNGQELPIPMKATRLMLLEKSNLAWDTFVDQMGINPPIPAPPQAHLQPLETTPSPAFAHLFQPPEESSDDPPYDPSLPIQPPPWMGSPQHVREDPWPDLFTGLFGPAEDCT